MKKQIKLRRIFHREASRLAIFFDFDDNLARLVKKIPGVKYSGTNKCFYTDDTEEKLREIIRTLKDKADLDIRDLAGSRFQVPDSEKKKEEVLSVLPEKNQLSNKKQAVPKKKKRSVEFMINESNGTLIVRLPIPYEKEWVDELKSFHGRFDFSRKEWIFTLTKMTSDSLTDYFSAAGVEVVLKKEAVSDELKQDRKKTGDEIRGRKLSDKALNGLESMALYLDENRYSSKTREAYLQMMEFFFRYFEEKEPDEITSREISEFIYNIIIKLGYSSAYQNQMISAIKTYYQASGSGQMRFELLSRPRKRRSLPKTFSKEEVSRILNSSGNLKHKLLLWIIYSCGLRRSEAVNLKLSDFDRQRGLIHIREGKGMVDRIVPVPDKVWHKLDEYMAGYAPKVYLFEGQTGGKYSSESVYRVFRQALVRAGINKDVGVHSLRHSYATHLHENGLDIKYIQELLGHKSTRTTEIYTHVSRRNLVAIRSPIEDIDVK